MGIFEQLEGMEEIVDDFVVETNELVEQLNEDLLLLEEQVDDDELVNRVFRAFHTIKGTSGFLDFTTCVNVAHAAEDILNKVRNKTLKPNSYTIDVLLETVDWIKGFVTDVANREEKDYDVSDLVNRLEKIAAGDQTAPSSRQEASAEESPKADTTPTEPKESAGELEAPPELVKEFTDEADELLGMLTNELLELENNETPELVNKLFRAFHTLKGNSGLLGLEEMATVAHRAEDLLGKIREGKLHVTSQMVDILLQVTDFFKDVVDQVRQGNRPTGSVEQLIQGLDAVYAPAESTEAASSKPAQTKPERSSSKKKSKTSSTKIESTIRVDVERLNNLMNLAGELVLEKNRLQRVAFELNQRFAGMKEVGDLDSVNNSLGYITTEIQQSVMQMRMLPISNVFRRFPRLVRDLSREKHKEIELILQGEDTELDRSVIELIGDPLVHLLRNSIDHGIEEPEERVKKGKPRQGKIVLNAYQEGNQIVIEVEDDGRGIDPEKVKAKAIEKGLVTEEELRTWSKREIINLIFKPGFSTAKVVSDVSGRGVGMDVVNSNISKLNGTIEILTEVGQGTKMIIKLPLTLAIQSGMVVKVYDELYIIPLISISETLRLTPDMLSSIKGRQVFRLRDEVLPVIRLDELLEVPKVDTNHQGEYIVVVNVAEKRVGLVVSHLLGQEETVVKPLGRVMGKAPYITGATIRGDGRVCLILDVPSILENFSRSKDIAA